MLFITKFKDHQTEALTKFVVDFDLYGDEAIVRFPDEYSTEN